MNTIWSIAIVFLSLVVANIIFEAFLTMPNWDEVLVRSTLQGIVIVTIGVIIDEFQRKGRK